MAQKWVHCANGDVRCVAVADGPVTLNCVMVSFVVLCSSTNAVVVRASHGSCHDGHGVAVTICRPNMRADLHGEYSVGVCCVPIRLFPVHDADIPYLSLYHLHDECYHMILLL